ncbi:DUF3558 family protein [Actinokineospora sp.]|uniref:DUF3558 family protein n=1 Tax=Actinokineospora sp. TaxID=1872133 RepID=UPI0040380D1B
MTVKQTIRRTLLPSTTMLLIGLISSCSETPGQAVPMDNRTSPTVSAPVRTSTKPPDGNALKNLDPCTLLTEAEVSLFGAQTGVRDDTAAPACQWTVRGQGVFSVAIRAEQGLQDIVIDKGTLVDHPLASHQGRRLEENSGAGGCMVSIRISESSRVDANSVARSDTAKACEFAGKVAELIEPRLPKGE